MVNEGFVSVKEKVIGMGIKILFSRKIEAPCYTRSFSEYVRMRLSLYKCTSCERSDLENYDVKE